MNRRHFLSTVVGGVAAAAAVRTWPFRVYSFPNKVELAPIDTSAMGTMWMHGPRGWVEMGKVTDFQLKSSSSLEYKSAKLSFSVPFEKLESFKTDGGVIQIHGISIERKYPETWGPYIPNPEYAL
jgi:hypothetical protein